MTLDAGIIATQIEVYVAERPPTSDELLTIAQSIMKRAREKWTDDRRQWTSFEALTGYIVGMATHYHTLHEQQYDTLVDLIMLELKNTKK